MILNQSNELDIFTIHEQEALTWTWLGLVIDFTIGTIPEQLGDLKFNPSIDFSTCAIHEQ